MKYDLLTEILDAIRKDAPDLYKSYHDVETEAKLTKARCRAYIHLLLKMKFKIEKFENRECLITDEGGDGGLDAYFIDKEEKVIYLIQSKFRTTEKNFESKDIEPQELIKMEYDRIIKGEKEDSYGTKYNSKILNFQVELSKIDDTAEYTYRIVILANLKKCNDYQIKKMIGEYSYDIYDYEKTYKELIYPICTSDNHEKAKMVINLYQQELSILQEEFNVSIGKCKTSVIFLPVIEIAKLMNTYKNSILKYNPRNYLSISESEVNSKIKKSILEDECQEFGILNNGITILCDSFKYTCNAGVKDKKSIIANNPQIINGAQTSYTLSKIWNDNKNKNIDFLKCKKVMVKFIEVIKDDKVSEEDYIDFIYKISDATNTQNTVDKSDRTSNKKTQKEFQKFIYDNYGYLYERKKGEYYPILSNKNIESKKVKSLIIKKAEIIRCSLAYSGKVRFAKHNKGDNLLQNDDSLNIFDNESLYNDMFLSFLLLKKIEKKAEECKKDTIEKNKNIFGITYGKYAMLYASGIIRGKLYNDRTINTFEEADKLSNEIIQVILDKWRKFEESLENIDINNRKEMYSYYKTAKPESDIKKYFE